MPKFFMGESDTAQNVNQPMGEAYSAYWNKWLHQGAALARAHFDLTASFAASPIAIFDQLYEQYGGQAVFNLARRDSQMAGFDVQSLLFSSAPNVETLVRRWQKVAQAQASIRFGAPQSLPDFVQTMPNGEIILSPSHIRPANLSRFGTAMLTGVTAHALSRFTPERVEILECSKAGRSRTLSPQFGQSQMDFDPTSDIILRFPTSKSDAKSVKAASPYLQLNHLFNHQANPFFRQLIQHLDQQQGGHLNIEICAQLMGTSVRTLSRRLALFDMNYGRLTRFVRLRKAVRLLHAGHVQMDDVAFAANYADRHHMARDFRQMIQLSPSLLRDLFAESTRNR
ncbi:helix-turn-helix domain-containing protein [Maritalea sp. S77]|uniref:helix-turn-helix domain-containing protein n=1 Tax=Maritalea sp. S77 TaxID=3415125 RepID=UPI003C7D5FE5